MGENDGILFIAYGDKCLREASKAMSSVKKNSPGIPVAVITDGEWCETQTPDYLIQKKNYTTDVKFSRKMKTECIYEESPFQRTLFLDTDVYVAKDIKLLFGLLDYYDFGAKFYGPFAKMKYPDKNSFFHLRCQSGVILFKKNDKNKKLFTLYKRYYAEAQQNSNKEGLLLDEPFLTKALIGSDVKTVHLGESLNFHLPVPTSVCNPIYIFHGRDENIETIAEEINGKWKDPINDVMSRVWLPEIKGFLPRGLKRLDALTAAALSLRRILNIYRRRWKGRAKKYYHKEDK